ncbi:MAG: penicillin-binding protein activator LpoB [Holophagaceae bacterium]|nr:penicillin-binding protein activator LpoB [Holophagaceae bacterium]
MTKFISSVRAAVVALACVFCGSLVAQDQKLVVAVLEPSGNSTVTNMTKAAARGTMEDFLSRSNKYSVVDRGNTDKIFQELGFQRTSGMVSDENVKEIGKQLGADLVCVIEILKEGGEANVTASLINVVSGAKDTRSGFIEEDSNRAISDLLVNLASRLTDAATPLGMVTPRATTPAATAPATPAAVGLQDPRIAVVIPEQHRWLHPYWTWYDIYRSWTTLPGQAAETAILRKMLEAGYTRMVDKNQVTSIINADKAKALMEGDVETAKAMAVQLGVDYIIMGQGFSEAVGRVAGNMFSSRGTVEARVIRTDTGQILVANTMNAGGADLVQATSANKALSTAGGLMGDYIVQQLRNRGGSAKTEVNLTVTGVTSFARLRELEQALKGIKEINAVYIRENAMGVARIDLDTSVTAQTIAGLIEEIKTPRVQVTETSGSAIKLTLR